MKILFTGGGTGGHFYPVIAITEAFNRLAEQEKFFNVNLYYMADTPFDERLLFENGIIFKKIDSGKVRRYFSFKNFTDIFKTGFAVLNAIFQLYKLYPDVVVGKGGYASFPVLVAAVILNIPIIIHESDSIPGAVNKLMGRFASKIAISYAEAINYFPKEKTALTGNPIRKAILNPIKDGSSELFALEEGIPVIFIIGGSQGARIINDAITQVLPELVSRYQIIHQTGKKNIKSVRETASVVLRDNVFAQRYKPFAFLDDLSIRMAAGVSSLVVSRAGSAIFEIAVWGLPSIIIPIKRSNGDHQRKNAYIYARTGACDVIEEGNLTPHILLSEIDRLIGRPDITEKMSTAAKEFSGTSSADKIAEQILNILHKHKNNS